MTMAKKLPLLAPSIHTFEVNGTYTDCEAKRTVFMAIQKILRLGQKESRWTPQQESSGIQSY